MAQSLGQANTVERRVWCNEGMRPSNVPADPSKLYKHGGWQGWGHWLRTWNLQAKKFVPFAEALAVARSLGLASRFEWNEWSKEGMRPVNVPSAPDKTYKHDGWLGWEHWLRHATPDSATAPDRTPAARKRPATGGAAGTGSGKRQRS